MHKVNVCPSTVVVAVVDDAFYLRKIWVFAPPKRSRLVSALQIIRIKHIVCTRGIEHLSKNRLCLTDFTRGNKDESNIGLRFFKVQGKEPCLQQSQGRWGGESVSSANKHMVYTFVFKKLEEGDDATTLFVSFTLTFLPLIPTIAKWYPIFRCPQFLWPPHNSFLCTNFRKKQSSSGLKTENDRGHFSRKEIMKIKSSYDNLLTILSYLAYESFLALLKNSLCLITNSNIPLPTYQSYTYNTNIPVYLGQSHKCN